MVVLVFYMFTNTSRTKVVVMALVETGCGCVGYPGILWYLVYSFGTGSASEHALVDTTLSSGTIPPICCRGVVLSPSVSAPTRFVRLLFVRSVVLSVLGGAWWGFGARKG